MNLICCLVSPLAPFLFEQSTAFCVRVWFREITICLPYLEIGQDIQVLKMAEAPAPKK